VITGFHVLLINLVDINNLHRTATNQFNLALNPLLHLGPRVNNQQSGTLFLKQWHLHIKHAVFYRRFNLLKLFRSRSGSILLQLLLQCKLLIPLLFKIERIDTHPQLVYIP